MAYQNDFSRAKRMAAVRFAFYIHLVVYVFVNLMLIAINLATTPWYFWFMWPLLGWGIGLLAHGVVTSALPLGGKVHRHLIEEEMRKSRP